MQSTFTTIKLWEEIQVLHGQMLGLARGSCVCCRHRLMCRVPVYGHEIWLNSLSSKREWEAIKSKHEKTPFDFVFSFVDTEGGDFCPFLPLHKHAIIEVRNHASAARARAFKRQLVKCAALVHTLLWQKKKVLIHCAVSRCRAAAMFYGVWFCTRICCNGHTKPYVLTDCMPDIVCANYAPCAKFLQLLHFALLRDTTQVSTLQNPD